MLGSNGHVSSSMLSAFSSLLIITISVLLGVMVYFGGMVSISESLEPPRSTYASYFSLFRDLFMNPEARKILRFRIPALKSPFDNVSSI